MLSPYHFMSVAHLVAQAGTCSRLSVGAVIVRDRRIISTGYNGAPSGMDHCNHIGNEDPCRVAVHAEANAIAYAAKSGIETKDAELYVTHSPCYICATLIVNAGIGYVYYLIPFRSPEGKYLLVNAGVPVERLDPAELLDMFLGFYNRASMYPSEPAQPWGQASGTVTSAVDRGGSPGWQ